MSRLKNLRETAQNAEAFRTYYAMGEDRTLLELSKKIGMSFDTTKRWSLSFNWKNRVLDLDEELAKKASKKLEKKMVDKIAEEKTLAHSILRSLLIATVKKIESNTLKVNNIYELQSLMAMLDKNWASFEEVEDKIAETPAEIVEKIGELAEQIKLRNDATAAEFDQFTDAADMTTDEEGDKTA